MADITPPVALASYACSAIAKSNPMRTALNASKLAIAAFIVPYIFALNPAMLFIDTTAAGVVMIVVTSIVGLFGVSAGLEGFMMADMPMWQRILSVIGGLMLIYPGNLTDILGVAIVGVVLAMQVSARRKAAA